MNVQGFWSRTKVVGNCIEWTGCKTPLGYGRLRFNGAEKYAHRLAVELVSGPLKHGAHVMHSCDNPSCVSIQHLSVGSPKMNTADMIQKGRGFWQNGRPPRGACPNGHGYTPENTGSTPSRPRFCRTCARETWRRNH